jgi:hypothetical protein
MRRGFRSNRGDALDKRQLAAPSRQTLSDKRSGTAASAKRAREKLPLGITFARARAKAAMLPTLEPENNHVAAVLTQQAGADQRQRFAHAGQCAPTERQLQAGRRPARRDARRWRCFFVTIRSADSHRALPIAGLTYRSVAVGQVTPNANSRATLELRHRSCQGRFLIPLL